MSLPGLTINQLDGNLGLSQPTPSDTAVILGVCTGGAANTLYSLGSQTQLVNQLGAGKLVEDGRYILDNAGGPQYFMPVNPSIPGAVQSPTHVGSGSGSLALSEAPHQTVTFTIQTGGALGTAKATIQVGSGAISAPVSLPAGGLVAIAGTYASATFAAGTYVVGDVYTIATNGVVTHTGTGTPAMPTVASSPLDDYALQVTITTGGASGTAAFTYSLDGGSSVSAPIITPASGSYAIPNSGLVLTFSGTQTAGDAFSAQCAAPSFSGTDVGSALTALQTTYLGQSSYSLVYCSRFATSVSAVAPPASALQTFALAMKNQGVYIRALGECPTLGSVNIASGAVSIDSLDSDSVVASAFQNVVAEHAAMAAGDASVYLPNSGLTLRRCAGLVALARALQYEASENIGHVAKGGVNVAGIYRDENATPGLDAARLITLRTFPNVPGIYLTDGHTLALPTSDFAPLTNARVMDEACTIARAQAMPYVLAKLATSPKNAGCISAIAAGKINAQLTSALKTQLVDTSPNDATDAKATVDQSHNILSDGNLVIAVGVVPYGYSKFVTMNIALQASV